MALNISMTYTEIDVCIACNSSDLTFFYEYKSSPLTDIYFADASEALALPRYPLVLGYCNCCRHLQLKHQVDPSLSYSNYSYKSNITVGISQNFQEYAQELYSLNSSHILSLLDVGSNDGSFIQACKDIGMKAVGIEPSAELSTFANQHDRPTINAYFDSLVASKLTLQNQSTLYDYITFNNVLANIPNPSNALATARSLLKNSEAKIVIQTGYHPLQFSKGLFDYVYHEHYSYFSLNSISFLARRVGLTIHSYSISSLRGGTLRVILEVDTCTKIPPNLPPERFTSLLELYRIEYLINSSRAYLTSTLDTLKAEGLQVVGFGASHSTGILVHTLGLETYIDFLVDQNIDKHGFYMPGTSLQVFDTQSIFKSSSNKVAIILAWQYYDQIRTFLLENGFKGTIIRPILP